MTYYIISKMRMVLARYSSSVVELHFLCGLGIPKEVTQDFSQDVLARLDGI